MPVRVSVAVMILHLPDLIECSTTTTIRERCQTLNYFRYTVGRGDFRHPVAVGGGAGDLARLRRDVPRVFRGHRRAAAARQRDPAVALQLRVDVREKRVARPDEGAPGLLLLRRQPPGAGSLHAPQYSG